jgi:hypothetical protein
MEWITVRGANRYDYADAVYDMYQKSYAYIGTHIKSAKELVEKCPIWELCIHEGKPIAFAMSEKTDRGIKGVLSGTDGSKEGKRALIDNHYDKLTRPFHYGELSGKIKEISDKLGLKPIPADKAIEILKEMGKDPEKLDETTYRRMLRNIGPVDKSMYGHPAPNKFPQEWHALSKRYRVKNS